jgi:uncharacterized membrane protein YraQ (UPF0718 family)
MTPLPRIRRSSFEWSTAVIAALALAAAATVYLRDGQDRFLAIAAHDFYLFIDMLPKVLAGCLIGSFVTMLLPREVVARTVGTESGLFGLFVAMMVGAFLPGGPFAIYPVTAAFLALGADIGTAVAFITSWSLLGYNRALVWEMPFMGGDFVFWRVVGALPLPILGGLLGRWLARRFKERVSEQDKSGDAPPKDGA